MNPKTKPPTVTDLHKEFWTGCPHCEYDEADGGLFNHCDDCCRRITRVTGDFLRNNAIRNDRRTRRRGEARK